MSKKELHEQFVQTTTGSSSTEVALVLANIAALVLLRELILLFLKSKIIISKPQSAWCHFILDYIVLVFPMLSLITICSAYLISFLVLILISTAFLCGKLYISYFNNRITTKHAFEVTKAAGDTATHEESKLHSEEVPQLERNVVTQYRGIILLFTTLCILAVDFNVFPRRMAKTETAGYSVMDMGVGAFVIANALVAPYAKESERSSLKMVISEVKDSFMLILLGFGRFVSVSLTNYQAPEAEYGRHWNFFCTLASVKIFGRSFAALIRPRYLPLLGITLVGAYEYFLQHGFYEFLLHSVSTKSQENAVVQLIFDNRTGLSSSIGFLGLFFIWTYFARKFQLQRKHLRELVQFLLELFMYTIIGIMLVSFLPLPSRRLANASYVIWTTYLALGFLSGLISIQLLLICSPQLLHSSPSKSASFSNLQQQNLPGNFSLISAMNFNSIFLFLVANILTGLVNLSITTMYGTDFSAMVILTVYSFVVSGFGFWLYVHTIRVPLRLSSLSKLFSKLASINSVTTSSRKTI